MDNGKTFIDKNVLVVMSTYNGAEFIEEQMNSILQQENIGNIHILIRDDGSTDQTVERIEKVQRDNPEKITLVKGKNIGCNASFFALLKMAKGYDYYSISDQDDVWLPDKICVALQWLEKETDRTKPLLYASTSYLAKGSNLKIYGQTRKQCRPFSIYNTIIQNICPGHNQVFNNALLALLKKPIDVCRIYVYDAWITNMALLYGKILFNNESCTLYRQHRSNQLGYGTGWLGWLIKSFARMQNNEGLRYRRQIQYFIEINKKELVSAGYYKELEKIFGTDNFLMRIVNMVQGRLYRQAPLETMVFYVAYLMKKI